MKIIGVTGGVGCGKSAVLCALKEVLGDERCEILHADDAAKKIEQKGCRCYEELVELLGPDVLAPDGEIDKKKMSAMIFSDSGLLEKVNGIIHPAVREYILEKIDETRKEGKKDYFFLEAALLIECGYLPLVDEMWYVYADEKIRRKRLKESRGYTDEKIGLIMKSQLSDVEYRKESHFTVDNSGTVEESIKQIRDHLGI